MSTTQPDGDQCGHALDHWLLDQPGAACVRAPGHEHAHLYWKGSTPIVWDGRTVSWATPEGAFAAINGRKWDPGWLRDERIAEAVDDWPIRTAHVDDDALTAAVDQWTTDLAGGQA